VKQRQHAKENLGKPISRHVKTVKKDKDIWQPEVEENIPGLGERKKGAKKPLLCSKIPTQLGRGKCLG